MTFRDTHGHLYCSYLHINFDQCPVVTTFIFYIILYTTAFAVYLILFNYEKQYSLNYKKCAFSISSVNIS